MGRNDKLTKNSQKKLDKMKKAILKFKSDGTDIFDPKLNKKIDKISRKLIDLFQIAIKESQLELVLNDFVTEPKSWLVFFNDPFSGTSAILAPSLAECACGSNFNRFESNRREQIEASVMAYVKAAYPDPITAKINYLSFGGGDLLQDFIIIVKLLLAGYKHLNVNLVDPDHWKYQIKGTDYYYTRKGYLDIIQGKNSLYKPTDVIVHESSSYQQFSLLKELASYMKATLTIKAFASIEEYKNDMTIKPNVIMAVDFDDFYKEGFDDTMSAHKLLSSKGRMFLSVKKADFVFKKRTCIEMPKAFTKLINSLPSEKFKTIKIALLSPQNFIDVLHNEIIPYITKKSPLATSVELTLPEPQELTYFGDTKGTKHPNKKMPSDQLKHYIQLFLPRNIDLKINYIKGHSKLFKVLPQVNENQNLILYFGKLNTGGTKAVFDDIKEMHTKFAHADFICNMNAANKIMGVNQLTTTFGCVWTYDHISNSINIINGYDKVSEVKLKKLYENEIGKQNKVDLIQSAAASCASPN